MFCPTPCLLSSDNPLIQVIICCWQVLLSTTVELLLLNYMYQRNQCLQNKEFSPR